MGVGYGMSYLYKYRWWWCENECILYKNFILNVGERFKDIIDFCGYVCKLNLRFIRKGLIVFIFEL